MIQNTYLVKKKNMDYSLVIDKMFETNNHPGLTKLTSLVKKEQPSITSKQIKQWFDAQLEVQLLHKNQKAQPTGHIVADVKNELWCLDIYDLSKYKDENND